MTFFRHTSLPEQNVVPSRFAVFALVKRLSRMFLRICFRRGSPTHLLRDNRVTLLPRRYYRRRYDLL